MRWRHIRAGDQWARHIFALYPMRCEDGTTRWLEWVWVVKKACAGPDGGWTERTVYPNNALPDPHTWQ